MFRLLGILLGSAIAVAFLILLVGIPQIGSEAEPTPVAVQLPLQPEPLATPDTTDSAIVAEPAPDATATPAGASIAMLDDAGETVADSAIETEPDPFTEQAPAASLTVPAELRWYAFWSPFRSQIAANGFVARLQRVTGLDYRVVSSKPGVYEVAFAYDDDAEIQANLAQISAATGLDLPES